MRVEHRASASEAVAGWRRRCWHDSCSLQIDLGAPAQFDGVKLDSTGIDGDFSDSYEVLVSADATTWKSVACGSGAPVTDVGFAAQTARYVRILQKGAKSNWGSLHEVNAFCT